MPPARPAETTWHILTGEYPPGPGGVGDYSALVATGLADAGAEVHVWTSAAADATGDLPRQGFTVHRAVGQWSGEGLRSLGAALDSFPAPRRLLVQYAPNIWGRRGLNLGFCRWLGSRRERGDDVRPMFHELWYEFDPRDRPTRWVFPVAQRLMVRAVMRASTRAYASIPRWVDWLRPTWLGGGKPVCWLPVPSNVPVADDPQAVAAVRSRFSPRGLPIVGSFGTFHGPIGDALAATLRRIGVPHVPLLIGRGSEAFAARHCLGDSMVATGPLPAGAVSCHIQACDLMVQPYPDGITSRRGSAMAALAHGRAVVTTSGWLTEPLWGETGAVRAVEPPDLGRATGDLLLDPEGRAALAARGLALYGERFALARTVDTLLRDGS